MCVCVCVCMEVFTSYFVCAERLFRRQLCPAPCYFALACQRVVYKSRPCVCVWGIVASVIHVYALLLLLTLLYFFNCYTRTSPLCPRRRPPTPRNSAEFTHGSFRECVFDLPRSGKGRDRSPVVLHVRYVLRASLVYLGSKQTYETLSQVEAALVSLQRLLTRESAKVWSTPIGTEVWCQLSSQSV